MRRICLLVGVFGLLFAVAPNALAVFPVARVQPGNPSMRSASASPKVVCLTRIVSPESAYGRYRRKPRHCIFHDLGEIFIGATTYKTRKLRWPHWGYWKANGLGIALVSTVGPTKVRIRLRRPRTICGERVFTRWKVRLRINLPNRKWDRWRGGPISNCVG